MLIFDKDDVTLSLVLFFTITSVIAIYLAVQIVGSGVKKNLAVKQDSLTAAIEEYEQVRSDLSDYEGKIRALSPATLDKDFLEEQAREKLLYTKKNEVVIFKD